MLTSGSGPSTHPIKSAVSQICDGVGISFFEFSKALSRNPMELRKEIFGGKWPTLTTCEQISEVFRVPLDELMDGQVDPKKARRGYFGDPKLPEEFTQHPGSRMR